MSAQTAKSSLSFQLPSLSYIDASWEEPNLLAPPAVPAKARKSGLGAWLSRQVSGLVAWQRDRQALLDLSAMTEHELMDIGLTRGDLPRVFDRAFSQDLRQRGSRI